MKGDRNARKCNGDSWKCDARSDERSDESREKNYKKNGREKLMRFMVERVDKTLLVGCNVFVGVKTCKKSYEPINQWRYIGFVRWKRKIIRDKKLKYRTLQAKIYSCEYFTKNMISHKNQSRDFFEKSPKDDVAMVTPLLENIVHSVCSGVVLEKKWLIERALMLNWGQLNIYFKDKCWNTSGWVQGNELKVEMTIK